MAIGSSSMVERGVPLLTVSYNDTAGITDASVAYENGRITWEISVSSAVGCDRAGSFWNGSRIPWRGNIRITPF